MKKYFKIILFNIVLFIMLIGFYELYMYTLVRNPAFLKKCPRKIQNSIGYLYAAGDRRVIQFMPDCAKYDNTLGYTLKQGKCEFSEREYSNQYYINSLGVRDDETSLADPKIIVVGDSVAMGWGVNQEETFAQIIERKTGVSVLNASISSYGTAREMLMLNRIRTDRLRYLIIQYSSNDYEENKAFYIHDNVLPTMSADDYLRYTEMNNQSKKYFFGKYLLIKLKKRIDEFRKPRDSKEKLSEKDEVDLFLNAIEHSSVNLTDVQIIAFVVNGRNPSDNIIFTETLTKRVSSGNYPPFIKNMIILDMARILKCDHFYVLDDHPNRLGHEAIADALVHALQERGDVKLSPIRRLGNEENKLR